MQRRHNRRSGAKDGEKRAGDFLDDYESNATRAAR